MGGLFSSLISTTTALRAYDNALTTVQNNVANAQTPGYAKQRLTLVPDSFDLKGGLSGGVHAGKLISFRDQYTERNIWRQSGRLGKFSQQAADLEQIEPLFPIGQDAGISGALNKFFSSVTSWSVNPNDPVARKVVLDRAGSLARSFNETANALGEATNNTDRQLRTVVDKINDVAAQIRDYNVERRSDRRKLDDPALDAKIYASLEDLSSSVDINVVQSDDGSLQLLFGGQTPLVIGDQQHKISVDFSQTQPRILNDNGDDITYQVNDGSLKGLLETRNTLIPKYQEKLNTLASTFADQVNQVLSSGVDANGSPPGIDLFTYDSSIGSALTLQVTSIDPSQLAAADTGAPGGNGNALTLANLATGNNINGISYTQYYGDLGADVGRDLLHASNNQQVQKELLTQGQQIREERSGVSLDEEAARLVEAQRAYQANAQLFQVLNSLTETLINLLKA